MKKEIIEKYNVASPRYTSYPTILDWNQPKLDKVAFDNHFKSLYTKGNDESISVYIHLPYCESLCTFCGCHKHITKNHSVEEPYIDALIKEWDLYIELAGGDLTVDELHLGGGTPTFFSASELKRLVQHITKNQGENIFYSVEGHPNHTSKEQMQTLFELGFRRISFGVQDYSPTVQKAINRIQSFDQVKKVTQIAREIGFTSVSHDLVFGLPFQDMNAIQLSIEKTLTLKPDNISLYSYAHVPWIKGTGQRGFSENDIPKGKEKKALYDYAKEALLKNGYIEIGMDHFGLPNEPMTIAMQKNQLNRNFMGYTTAKTERMIGLGVSAISEYPFGYAQNIKSVKEYLSIIHQGELPVFKGHFHSFLDKSLKKHIKSLMCQFKTDYCPSSYIGKNEVLFSPQFKEFEKDGILKWEKGKIEITEEGRPFVRNVCMTIDPYIQQKMTGRFSKSV